MPICSNVLTSTTRSTASGLLSILLECPAHERSFPTIFCATAYICVAYNTMSRVVLALITCPSHCRSFDRPCTPTTPPIGHPGSSPSQQRSSAVALCGIGTVGPRDDGGTGLSGNVLFLIGRGGHPEGGWGVAVITRGKDVAAHMVLTQQNVFLHRVQGRMAFHHCGQVVWRWVAIETVVKEDEYYLSKQRIT